MGSALGANFVLLGAYVGLTGALAPELIEAQIEQRFPPENRMRELNRQAFRDGLTFGRQAP